jgi:hypothetical protein
MLDKFNAANYKKQHSLVIASDKDEGFESFNGLTLSSKLIIVTWVQIATQSKSISDKEKSLGTGIARISPIPTPIGVLPPMDFDLDVFAKPFVQFLDLSKIEVDYRLSFKNPKGITRTQVTIQEYVESDSYVNSPSNAPVIA